MPNTAPLLDTARTTLLEPSAEISGRRVMFLRDVFGGEVPLSCPYPPLELMTAAALLRAQDAPVELMCANVKGWGHAEIARRLSKSPPARLLVPSAWGSLDDDLSLMRRLRRAVPNTMLMMSGPNVTAEPQLALSEGLVDVVIQGEPEEAISMLAAGHSLEETPNLAWWTDGAVQRSLRRLPPDYPNYPLPARDLVNLADYTPPFCRRLPATTMAASRGCAHPCTFCPSQIWHQRVVRARNLDLVMEELDELTGRYGAREIVFRDDTFTHDRSRVVAICHQMLRRGYDLTWRCFATVDSVDPDLLALMAAAGCVQICYGFESGDDAILAKTGKRTTVEQGRLAAHWTHLAGIEVAGTFIVGLEGDSASTVQRSIDFAMDNRLDYVQINAAAPLPGTGFAKRYRRRGLDGSPRRFRWFGGNTSETRDLSTKQVGAEVRRFYRQFYLRPSYVAGRLRSKRGLHALWRHAVLGSRMALYLTEPLIWRTNGE